MRAKQVERGTRIKFKEYFSLYRPFSRILNTEWNKVDHRNESGGFQQDGEKMAAAV